MAKKGHHVTGKVAGVSEHHSGKHVEVSIAHGRRSPRRKGKDNEQPVPFGYDDRPRSHLVVPKEHADKYRVGQHVRIRISDPEEAAEATDAAAEESKDAARGMFDATHRR